MRNNSQAMAMADSVDRVYFYGAGSSSPELCAVIAEGLRRVFPGALVHVGHDLDGAAYSTYTGEPAVTCILGTGSNSCMFDGEVVREEVPALAYILGDEGSGSWFGKKLLASFLYHKLPQAIHNDFAEQYGLDKLSITKQVYQEPNANVFLASFMTFLGRHKADPFVLEWLDEGFKAFLDVHVACFEGLKTCPFTLWAVWRTISKRPSKKRVRTGATGWATSSKSPLTVWRNTRAIHSSNHLTMGLKACLFDMDGVIVDSAVHHFVAWKRLADELSISFTEEDNHALKGLSRVDSLDHILRMGQLQLDEKTKVKLMDQKTRGTWT